MAIEDFTNCPVHVDDVGDGISGTLYTKYWWENVFYPWIYGMVRHQNYLAVTPADIIYKVMTGNLNPPLILESTSTHTLNATADNKQVYIRSSQFVLGFPDNVNLQWPGGWLDFGSGDHICPAFDTAGYYRKVNAGIINTDGVATIQTQFGDEAETIGELPEPEAYSAGYWYYSGATILRNNGTIGVDGEIYPVAQSQISSLGLNFVARTTPFVNDDICIETWIGDGPLSVYTAVDGTRRFYSAGLLTDFVVTCQETGSGGDDLVIHLNVNDTVVAIATIPAASGDNQSVVVTSFISNTYDQDDSLSVDIVSVPTGSATITCRLHYRLN
jgi:hypothetical protein